MGDWDLRIPTTIYKIGTNENPLCSTGSSTQGSAMTEMGRKFKKKKKKEYLCVCMGFPESSVGKESACDAGDPVRFLGREDPLEKG